MGQAIPASLLGFNVSGDVGPWTIYTDRYGRKIVYPRAIPKKPPSPLQVPIRSQFAKAMRAWLALPCEDKLEWARAVNTLSLMLTAHNLWISLWMKPDPAKLATLNRQARTALQMPREYPTSTNA